MTQTIEYDGLVIKQGADNKWYVTRDGANILPGATFARSEDKALQLADVYLVADGDAGKFWHLLRAIQRQTGGVK